MPQCKMYLEKQYDGKLFQLTIRKKNILQCKDVCTAFLNQILIMLNIKLDQKSQINNILRVLFSGVDVSSILNMASFQIVGLFLESIDILILYDNTKHSQMET